MLYHLIVYIYREDPETPEKHETIVWNRDINAPRNMIYLLLYQLKDQQIGGAFRRSQRWTSKQEIEINQNINKYVMPA